MLVFMTVVEPPKKIWKEAELQALPEDGVNHELVNGELVFSPKNDFFHGDICSRLSAALVMFNSVHKLGAVLDSSTGFWMKNRNCRAPDISFVSRGRLAALGFRRSTRAFFPGAPDLAVEVLSPNNTRAELDERLRDFFESGSRLAWIIDPERQRAEVCHSLTERKLVGSGGFLEGADLLPGFRYPIADLFKEWDWE
jgi:Uma2 family endonuclease